MNSRFVDATTEPCNELGSEICPMIIIKAVIVKVSDLHAQPLA
jgi:hypothetical protein